MSIKKLSRFTVAARENNSGWWDVEVVAETSHKAKITGIEALQNLGLINKLKIKESRVHDHNDDLWVGV
jgi:hypothetical protein